MRFWRGSSLSGVPAELRMAYKVLKNAGFVPPEVEMRKEIVSLREMPGQQEDDAERCSSTSGCSS